MPIKVTCPKCNGVLHAPDGAGGKRGRCPTCGTVLSIPQPASPTAKAGDGHPFEPGEKPSPASEPAKASSMMGGADPQPPYRFQEDAPASRPEQPGSMKPGGRKSPAGFGSPAAQQPIPDEAPGWRKVSRGLWWTRTAVFFLILAVLVPTGVAAYAKYGQPLPDKNPGYAGIEGISAEDEIRSLSSLAPALLGLLAYLFGRLYLLSTPRGSFARGLMRFSTLGVLLGIAGIVAALVPVVQSIAANGRPESWHWNTDLLPWQRLSIIAAASAWLIAEVWFIGGIGRIGTSLADKRSAGRSTRLLLLLGLLGIAAAAGAVACQEFRPEMESWYANQVEPQWEQLGEHQPIALSAAGCVAALIFGFIYFRLIGATRRAIWAKLEGS